MFRSHLSFFYLHLFISFDYFSAGFDLLHIYFLLSFGLVGKDNIYVLQSELHVYAFSGTTVTLAHSRSMGFALKVICI